ncbi:MAG: alpha/beta fold hydrolase [Gammaproteobacteria bacterium]|nr:alpha/beta fold hydrolase [Gammaproteobacteria bacterium]
MEEGFIDLEHGRIWYRRSGGGSALPVLFLHGGPGAASSSLSHLRSASPGIVVIVYDQLGCGRSDKPDNPSLWTLDYFTSEVDQMRNALGLNECHLLGHSSGGWLSIDYLCGARKEFPRSSFIKRLRTLRPLLKTAST